VRSVSPSASAVTVNSFAGVFHSGAGGSDVVCKILESTEASGTYGANDQYIQWFETDSVADNGTLNGTRTFTLEAGETKTFGLRCREIGDGGDIRSRILTAIFTPTP